jgi:phosphoglycerate kinase
MNLPEIVSLKVSEKKVLLRADLDILVEEGGTDFRLKALLPTINYLIKEGAKVIILGHRGRPRGKIDLRLSLAPVAEKLGKLLGQGVKFIPGIAGDEAKKEASVLGVGKIMMLENLRFDPREEKNDPEFAKKLASLGAVYVNEAFATSHRKHASIVGLPRFLPHRAGFRLVEEVRSLNQVLKDPKRPLVVAIGGAKKDKVSYIDDFKKFADKILIGGRLPDYLGDAYKDEKVLVAQLIPDKEDITINSIERFKEEFKKAGTIVLAGPMSRYEEEGHMTGTKRVFEAVADSSAFKVTGGRETLKVISMFNLEDKFDWISVGGGAMLEFLAKGALPGIEALLN